MAQTKIRIGQLVITSIPNDLGIGTSVPAYKVDADGDINARQGWTHRVAGNDIMNGWIPQGQYPWTRTGNHVFTISGDVTATYRKGVKVRYKDGGSYEYGTILSSSYSSPNTTVNLITNSDYTMAAASITDNYISHDNLPEGFPLSFAFAPAATGFSGTPTQNGNFAMVGGVFYGRLFISGTSNATTLGFTSPVAIPDYMFSNFWVFRPSSSANLCLLEPGAGTLVNVFKDGALTAWSASGDKEIRGTYSFPMT